MLADEPAAKFLSETQRRALRGALSLPAGKTVDIVQGPLWLVSSPARMRRGEGRILAWDGFLPTPGPQTPDPADPWEGHYALAHADWKNHRLILLRDFSGGENLYYFHGGKAIIFANSMRPLLAWKESSKKICPEALAEFMFTGPALCAGKTLFEGIQELAPGGGLTISRGEWRHHQARFPFLEEDNASAGPEASPRALRRLLLEATGRALGGDREVAVALSGGIDSATIAALAAELLGPRNVTALTYEFDEPKHPSEAPIAALTARRLGLRHRVLKIRREQQLEAVPRYCWHVQDARMRGNSALLLLMEQAVRDGFGKLLTGDGVEHILGLLPFRPYLRDLAGRIPWTPLLDWTLSARRLPLLKHALPARKTWPPHQAIFGPVLCVLRYNGLIRDMTRFYPPALSRWVRRLEHSPRMRGALRGPDSSLGAQLEHACFHSHLMPRMLWKRVALARAAGLILVAPALLRRCAALTPRFAAQTWSAHTLFSRHLQQEAMAGILPPEVLQRSKIPEQAIAPSAWLEGVLAAAQSATRGWAGVKPLFSPEEFAAARAYCPYPLAQAALMNRVYLESAPRTSPPTWANLRS